MDNSVDPSSQRADCESTSSVFAFGNGNIRDQLRLAKGAIFPKFERFLPIPDRYCCFPNGRDDCGRFLNFPDFAG